MRLLLDTHVLLWWLMDPALLSDGARCTIEDGENIVYVSAAVAWEIAIKSALGKLRVGDLIEALDENQFLPLPITVTHALAIEKLPPHHRDPFYRMLVAQAMSADFRGRENNADFRGRENNQTPDGCQG
jgi:PIN domain nuclease of toxin-antitoxin system